jgi:phosphatidylglycerophosphate synthase
METVFPWLVALAVGATFVVLVIGVLTMLRGNPKNAERSNKLMRYRVIFQFGAIVLIALAFLLSRSGGGSP